MNRRDFLKILAATSAAPAISAVAGSTAGAATVASGAPATPMTRATSPTTSGPSTNAAGHSTSVAAQRAIDAKGRSLVVVELSGGNDGLSTLIPVEDGAYRRLRSRTFIDPATALRLNGRFGLHPRLTRLHERGVAVVAGVGVTGSGSSGPDLSHFEMTRRWWQGDQTGLAAPDGSFLGRLCDVAGQGSALAGLSVGSGAQRSLTTRTATTLSLSDLDSLRLFADGEDDDRARAAFRLGFSTMSAVPAGAAGRDGRAAAAAGSRQAIQTAVRVEKSAKDDNADGDRGYPGGGIGQGLRLAARALAADVGIRVVHVTQGGYDTHGNHVEEHGSLMDELDQSLAAFLDDIKARNLDAKVLVATISEFGRRAADNGSAGLDHGAASVALLAGPVHKGVFGEHPSLTKLDAEGNLRATVSMHDYLSTLAGWLHVPGELVLSGRPAGIKGVLAT